MCAIFAEVALVKRDGMLEQVDVVAVGTRTGRRRGRRAGAASAREFSEPELQLTRVGAGSRAIRFLAL